MKEYRDLLNTILHDGKMMEYRNGNRMSIFDYRLRFDLREGVPLVSIKKTNWKAAAAELLWFISGSTHIKDLNKIQTDAGMKPARIWDKFADVDGDIGRVYGYCWRHAPADHAKMETLAPDMQRYKDYPGYLENNFDQLWYTISEMRKTIKLRRGSTRHRIATFIPGLAANENLTIDQNVANGDGGITPCVSLLKFRIIFINDKPMLDLTCTHLSNDVLLGGPFNYFQYGLMAEMVAHELGITARYLTFNIDDAHIYENQIEQMNKSKLLYRGPSDKPKLKLDDDFTIFGGGLSGIHVEGYKPAEFVNFKLS